MSSIILCNLTNDNDGLKLYFNKYVIPVHLFLIIIGKLLALARWPVSHNKNYSISIDLSDNYI